MNSVFKSYPEIKMVYLFGSRVVGKDFPLIDYDFAVTESFYILNEERLIPNNLTKKLAKMVGFRNIIAHDYEKIDYDAEQNQSCLLVQP